MIKNIFFDFNGTIIDDIDLTLDIENKLLVERGLKKVSREFYLDNFCFPVINYYKKSGFDFSKINYDELNGEFMKEYSERFLNDTKIFDDCESTLISLKEKGYKLYIYSATEIRLLRYQLAYFKIDKYFDALIASDNIDGKSKLEYGKEFVKNNDINPDESIMIGDTLHDFEVANEIGLKPVLCARGHNSKKVLLTANVPVIDSLGNIFDILN